MAGRRPAPLPPPFLKRVWLDDARAQGRAGYPFDLPLFAPGFELAFERPVTIIAGENGVGKSTLLEAIAVLAGFNESGGGPGHALDNGGAREVNGGVLAGALRGAWLPKMGQGFFFRAESFFALARYLDAAGSPRADFLSHSHGEGFLRVFAERCAGRGLYLFDEPESALSPSRQFAFLKLLRAIEARGDGQVIMATHSPILMALPGADLLAMSAHGLRPTRLVDTDHYRLYREFALDPLGTVEAMLD